MPIPLPIDTVLPELCRTLARGPAAVLRAPTGAGKTTRVPPALLREGLAGEGSVVMLEPRRVAARAAARRIAQEGGWRLGEEVGYQVRFDRRAGPGTRILVVTEGILVNLLQADPFLTGVGAVVFDEFHERALPADLSLAMARQVQREVRPDLKLVVMSATLEPEPLTDYLGGCPAVESEGRQHPVEVEYLARPDDRPLPARVAAGVLRALERTAGDVLAFLPGVGEIRRTAAALESAAGARDLVLLPLHGSLPPEEQDAALRPWDRRKVVLATNVAETSVTLEGIAAVVDSGLVRTLRYDPATGLDRLELGRASRASAEQRAGRAGRQGPGLCLRLWTEHDHRSLPERETPEIARVDLAGPVLQLAAWGETDAAGFGWFEAPDPTALERARELLERLGALDRRARVTELGRRLSRLPVHPRLGRLVLEGRRLGHGAKAALAAALLAERDPFRRSREAAPPPPSRSDLLDRVEALAAFEAGGRPAETSRGRLSPGAARHLLRARDQLAAAVRSVPAGTGRCGRVEGLLRAVLAAYPDRVARRREAGGHRGVMVGGRGVRLSDRSAVTVDDLFVCIEVDAGRPGERSEALVWQASAVEADWLPPERIETRDEVELDAERLRVVAWRRTRYEDLVIAESEIPVPDPAQAARVLAEAAASRLDEALGLGEEETAAFLARVRCLREWMPELGLPAFEEEELRELLPALCAGRRSFEELRRAPLVEALSGTLDQGQRQALEREAPERLQVPSGSRLRLAYEPGKSPVLAVRIQELFGQRETPSVAAGRVPVLLHLLAPNGRPQQVTQDLVSFWETTYPVVRKELQGRYPKHHWPADPWTATPESRPRRRKR